LLARQKQIEDDYQQILNMYCRYNIPSVSFPVLDMDNIESFIASLKTFKVAVLPDGGASGHGSIKALDYYINSLQEYITQRQGNKIVDQILIRDWIPNFILFSSFDDVFPSEIGLKAAADNALVKDLDSMSNLNLDLVQSGSAAQKAKHKRQLNLRLNKDYKRFWEQDSTSLYVDWDSDKLDFFVTEEEDFYPPRMRSKGKQWHLSFFIRVLARAREGDNIILIDEPGLYLHAHAQKDILATLQDCARGTQIVFSTHSPYFVEFDKLSRVRLVTRSTSEGSVVSNKIYRDADNDTLTPIISAIGLELSRSMDVSKNNNVIFEKISDYYYAIALQELTQFNFRQYVHFIPSLGSDQSLTLASLMVGWGLNFCIVLDNNSPGRKVEPKLLNDFANDRIKVISVSANRFEEIEDLFSKDDFTKYVVRDEFSSVLAYGEPQSHVIKREGREYDRILMSGLFLRDAREGKINLSEETLNNFMSFFNRLNDLLFSVT
jgi:predicted ATPase